jgi:hypothetical protein
VLKIKSEIYARVAVQDIDMLTKIIEAYDHLGIVSTINRQEGLVIVRGTADPPRKKNWYRLVQVLGFSL